MLKRNRRVMGNKWDKDRITRDGVTSEMFEGGEGGEVQALCKRAKGEDGVRPSEVEHEEGQNRIGEVREYCKMGALKTTDRKSTRLNSSH